jgi:RHS repeat-associated protein
MIKRILMILVFFSKFVVAQTTTENYAKTTIFQVPGVTNILEANLVLPENKLENISYFDGLGRVKQQIAYAQSFTGKDIVTHIEYDDFGRQTKEYLPYCPIQSATLDFKTTAGIDIYTFYNTPAYDYTLNPYSQTKFELSSLNRAIQKAAPGNDWNLTKDHTIKFDYQTNKADEVKRYVVTTEKDINGQYIPSVNNKAYYIAGQLFKSVIKDENWIVTDGNNKTTEEFKNKEGQIVLKRTYASYIVNGILVSKAHDTYYVYDSYGNLVFVIPPLVDKDKLIKNQISTSGYANFTKSFNQSVFSGTTNGSGTVDVTISNNVLKVVFSAGFNSSMLNTVPQDLLTAPCLLPDLVLGTISGGNYSVSIVGGKLKLTNLTGLASTGFLTTFTVNLPTSCDTSILTASINSGYENFSKSFYHSVFSGTTSGGGSVDVTISNNVLKVVFSAGFIASMLNTTPQDLPTLPCILPDMTLGTISGGNYKASIVGGKLKLTNLTGATSTGFASTFIVGLPSSCATTYAIEDQTVLDNLCYQYRYDYRNRLIEKKLPGKGWEYIVYNKIDQPILTQDVVQKAKGEWLFTKYDAFGRVAYTGKATNTTNASRESIQNEVDLFSGSLWVTQSASVANYGGTNIYYSNDAYPINSGNLVNLSEILTINYYDTYVDLPVGAPNSVVIMESPTNQTNTSNVKSLLTTNKVKVLDVAGTNVWITNLTYYDSKARPIYMYSNNLYLGTVDITESKLDFIGKVLKTKKTHIKNGITIGIIDNFTYDNAGRFKAQTQCIGDATMGYTCTNAGIQQDLSLVGVGNITTNQVATRSITVKNATILPNTTLSIIPELQELIVLNNYDELGQLKSKKVGGAADVIVENSIGLQTVDYNYNIRGWLTSINDVNTMGPDLFAFQINYNDISDPAKKLFNGNISQTKWKTSNIDKTLRGYVYQYDALNRLTNASDNSAINPNRYDETIGYDKNGNIINLVRNGNTDVNATVFGIMDNLSYTYNSGNRLAKVEDSSANTEGFNNGLSGANIDYGYDDNGNMTSDLNKNITSITYNHLNLPVKIAIGSGNIQYIYDATGVKLRKIVSTGTTTDYAGGFIYEGIDLKFFSHPEGYVAKNSGNFDYIYQYKDHLGNVRLSYDKNLKIVVENNYYPFGLLQKGYNNIPNTNVGSVQAEKYKYNGKELQDELGLNIYFFKFRSYDPALGRFWQIDPLAGTYAHNSTYAFAENNVSSGTDLEGLELSFHLNGNLATSQSGPRVTGGVNGNYTLQELKSHVAQKQAQEDRAMNKLMSGDPRNLPSGDIRPAKGDINVARFDDPGMMMADGARIGAEFMAMDIGVANAFGAIGKLGSEARSVWSLGAIQRGRAIEKMLGAASDWASNFPVIDKVANGVATSIKSLDLTASSYQKGNSVLNTLKGYINTLDKFEGATWAGTTVEKGADYTSKALELAVQTGKGSESQWNQINQAVQYALDKNINVTIKFIK